MKLAESPRASVFIIGLLVRIAASVLMTRIGGEHAKPDKPFVPLNVAIFIESANIIHRGAVDMSRIMAQTGDPTGTGTGGSKYPDLRAEFSLAPFERGTVGMARSQSPNSANSQFFICFSRSSFLNGKYTVFGQVVSGMEFIDKIRRGSGQSGMVSNPDVIKKMQVAADAK